MDLQVELHRVLQVLHEAGVEYALCGGLALAVHGAPRATTDIDLLMREDDVPTVLSLVEPLGYRFRANPMRFPDGMRIQRVTRIAGREAITLDLLLVDDAGATAEAFASRTTVSTGAGDVTVVSREGLVALKVWAGRPQDLADIQRLEDDDR
ncbi:MAG: nucleotidyltransferase [Alphaproteobacteria bacterium]|nr:nucleotidyltransferase [Alphaproteobacteria bacterium]